MLLQLVQAELKKELMGNTQYYELKALIKALKHLIWFVLLLVVVAEAKVVEKVLMEAKEALIELQVRKMSLFCVVTTTVQAYRVEVMLKLMKMEILTHNI